MLPLVNLPLGETDTEADVTRRFHDNPLQTLVPLAARQAIVELNELGVVPIPGIV